MSENRTDQSATREEIKEWEEENDGAHPVFEVPHRPERQPVETTTEKGNRNENEAKSILKRVYGAGVEKVDGWGNHDQFGFIDIIAISEDQPVKFVQVKRNRFTAEHKRKYQSRARHLPHEHAVFEVWVRIDREGWELFEFDGESFEQFAKLPCNASEAGEEYRSVHKESDL